MNMVKQTLEAWRTEATERFGKDSKAWAFVCPACGRTTTIQEICDAGGEPDDAYSCCIGRLNGNMRPASEGAREDGNGCDWAAFGLLGTLGKGRVVITPDGKEVDVFDFPPREVTTE